MQPDALTDDELLSIPNGDPLLGKLTSEEASRRTTLQLGKPPGSAATRQDTNILSLDHQGIQQRIANWASTLPPSMQRPAAMLATFPADVMASLAEMFSAPEAVAGAKPVMAGLDAVGAGTRMVGRAVGRGAGIAADLSPDVVGIASPRLANAMRVGHKSMGLLQRLRAALGEQTPAPYGPPRLAGKAPTVNDALVDALNEARQAPVPQRVSLPTRRDPTIAVGPTDPAPNVPAPVGPRMGAYSSQPTPASATPPAVPSAAPPAAAAPGPSRSAPAPGIRLTSEESQALQALVAEGHDPADVVKAIVQNRQAAQPSVAPKATGKPSLNAAEAKEYQRLLGRGKTHQEAVSIIEQQRAFVQSKGLPSAEEARRAVVDRNATGRWD